MRHIRHQSVEMSTELTCQSSLLFAIMKHWLGLGYILEIHQEGLAIHIE
jgi:hypothetical protein